MKTTLTIAILLTFFSSKGQLVNPWYGKITSEIDRIQNAQYDSVFSYIINYASPDPPDENVKGVGKVVIQGEGILIGFKTTKISCIRVIETFDSIYSSTPIDLTSDSTIENFRSKISGVKLGNILPYVCQVSLDSLSTITGFDIDYPHSHSPFYFLYFKCKSDYDVQRFDLDAFDMRRKYSNMDSYPINLNFKFNRSLNSYKLYSISNLLLTKYRTQFDFRK